MMMEFGARKRTNISISQQLYEDVQAFVKVNDSSLSKLVEALLIAFMDGDITMEDKNVKVE